jgi:hypothetical protein
MQEIPISKFKANCFAFLEGVRRTRQPIPRNQVWRSGCRSRAAFGQSQEEARAWIDGRHGADRRRHRLPRK